MLATAMSDDTSRISIAEQSRTQGSEALLRETLKRCSSTTIEAALSFRSTGDVAFVPAVVLGIVERFLDPDVTLRLRGGDDSVRFMEDLGLDSLTMIEAIMMVEESLGVSIKNEELIGLRTLGDLKSFIHGKVTGVELEPAAKVFRVEDIAALMPQQDPFLFLEEASVGDGKAKGKYTISGHEAFLQGHFKGNPVFPASIMLEALGQLAVFYVLKSVLEADALDMNAALYFTGADGVRCHRVCRPGDTLELIVELKRRHDPMIVFSGKISVGGEKAAVVDEISLVFGGGAAAGVNGAG